MIVSCPHCSTQFEVPDAAFGGRGRTLKCARCAQLWHEDAPFTHDDIPLESAGFGDVAAARADIADRMFDNEEMAGGDLALAELEALGFAGEGSERELEEEDSEEAFDEMSDLMRARTPESMPDVFSDRAPAPEPRRKGGVILWSLLLFLLLVATGAGLFWFQDRLIDQWPSLGKLYDKVGLRSDEVGVGLAFRDSTSERLPQDNSEVLIVRGVIANVTEQRREIPLLRLALYNGPTLLQEKIIEPPQPALEAKGTVLFRVTLDQPNVEATRFEVTFTRPQPAGK